MKLISVVTPCYNEEENIKDLYSQVKNVFNALGRYSYEHIFIDNASKDGTVLILKEIAGKDKNVKIIVNQTSLISMLYCSQSTVILITYGIVVKLDNR